MKALVLRGKEDLAVLDVPRPGVGRDEVLVRVHACGICGSDLRYYHGYNPWAKQTLGVEKPNPPNMVLGHEVAGEIVRWARRWTRVGSGSVWCCWPLRDVVYIATVGGARRTVRGYNPLGPWSGLGRTGLLSGRHGYTLSYIV